MLPIIKALQRCHDLLKPIHDAYTDSITCKLEEACKNIVANMTEHDFLIQIDTYEQAENLIECFTKQKLTLIGYELENKSIYDWFHHKAQIFKN